MPWTVPRSQVAAAGGVGSIGRIPDEDSPYRAADRRLRRLGP
ncbi:hypothetical protein TOK_3924 [Pseudonocardia sp. N23]|nr:hypothetical protein TOK_3924 [Pseudonocardia sp. N23]